MNEETTTSILAGGLAGVAATMTMDVLSGASRRIGLVAGAKGAWVGRWYLGLARGQLVHPDIAAAPEQRAEKQAALIGHYFIGVALAVLFVLAAGWAGLSPSSFFVAVGYGLATCAFPWFLLFPALGFGVLGREGPRELRLFTSSVLNHLFYGLGLWWTANLLRLG